MSTVVRIQEFLTSLDSISFTDIDSYRKAVNRLCKKELDYLRGHVELTTLRRYRTDYRNAIRKHYEGKDLPTVYKDKKNNGKPTHIAVKYFSLTRNEVATYADHEKERKDSYLKVFNSDLEVSDNRLVIINPNEMVNIAVSLLGSDSAYDIATGLLLLTGRRTVEIWKMGAFEYKQPNLVIFSGQAKTRDSENAKTSYPIFTLCDAHLVCQALGKLRGLKDFSNSTEREVNSSTSTRLSRVVKRNFNSFILGYDGLLEAKDLRSIYVHIAHHLFASHTVITAFASDILGHVIKATADNYMLFRLKKAL
jgi:hypothetical protein